MERKTVLFTRLLCKYEYKRKRTNSDYLFILILLLHFLCSWTLTQFSISTSLAFTFQDWPLISVSVYSLSFFLVSLFFPGYLNLVVFYGESDWNFWSLIQFLPYPFMSTQTASSSSTTSSSSSSLKYDEFLSFCSDDTCKNFTNHLYTILKRKGIITFRDDDEKLKQGKYISSQLLKSIEESKYAIIILSTNYASSRRCLIELT